MRPDFHPSLLEMLKIPLRDAKSPVFPIETLSPAVLEAQLEGPWQGVDNLKAVRRKALSQLARKIQKGSDHEVKWNFLLSPVELDPDAREIIDELATRHAYVATVTLALIEKAKKANGIMPSSDFLWARGKDEGLWLMVNGFGRPRALPEIAGAFAHYEAEKKFGGALHTVDFINGVTIVREKNM